MANCETEWEHHVSSSGIRFKTSVVQKFSFLPKVAPIAPMPTPAPVPKPVDEPIADNVDGMGMFDLFD